jgi:hypothetical protein
MAGHAPLLASVSAWPIIFVVSFLWYFAISYAVIKTYRFVSSRFFDPSPDWRNRKSGSYSPMLPVFASIRTYSDFDRIETPQSASIR